MAREVKATFARWPIGGAITVLVLLAGWAGLEALADLGRNLSLGIAAAIAALTAILFSIQAIRAQSAPPTPVSSSQIVVGRFPAGTVFSDRSELLEQLTELSGTGRVAVLSGLGGVGKTSVAAAYARAAVAAGWKVVVWTHATSEAEVIEGLAHLAFATGAARRGTDDREAAKAAIEWLKTQPGPNLLVFDDVDDQGTIERWMPSDARTQVVVTTRKPALWSRIGDGGAAVVDVSVLTRAEAVDFLLRTTGLTDRAGAGTVAEALGDLPLALGQASSLIGPEQCSKPVDEVGGAYPPDESVVQESSKARGPTRVGRVRPCSR